jgi:hypothetical protein
MKNQSDPGSAGNVEDHSYVAFVDSFREQFLVNIKSGGERLFTTDADPNELWLSYLTAFPEVDRQHHNCHACRHFIQQYGGLVTIDERGVTFPALFHHQDSLFYAMSQIVRRAKVTGVFFSPKLVLGTPVTTAWRHLSVILPQPLIYSRSIQTNEQAMAEKKENYKNICRALSEYPSHLVDQAVAILQMDTLYRSEKVLGQAEFLQSLHHARGAAVNMQNVTWRLVAVAPAGFCHPRASMIGTLLDDLASGIPFGSVATRFREKMHPLKYQRPTAPPAEQTIDRAEKVIADLGLTSALRRRFARVEEVEALWRYRAPDFGQGPGVFHHLREHVQPHPRQVLPTVPAITWVKFARDILPGATEIAFLPKRYRDNYGVIVTAADPTSLPILQWDQHERRNPFSSYVWHGGSSPSQFGLRLGEWQTVTAITLKPSMWYGADMPHQGRGVFFLLHGAQETRIAGAALFPENLRSELHSIRSVIEAHSKASSIEGIGEGSAVGIMLTPGIELDYLFRIKFGRQVIQDYRIDRWE